MLFGEIYRDVYSRLGLTGEDHTIYFDDISKAINDAVRLVRIEYIQQGLGHEFANTESLTTFTEDSDYPFVNSDTLSEKIMQDLPIEFTVLSTTSFTTDNVIQDTTQSFNKGDKARKGGRLYECVETFSGVNTFDLTFDPDNVRNYYPANGLKYDVGDIVEDTKNDGFYKVNTGFTNSDDIEASNRSELDKLYWKDIGTAYSYVAHYAFKFIQALRTFESLDTSEAIAVLDDKVYATPGVKELRLTYIPKWTEITDMEATFEVPDYMIPQIKNRALIQLGQKLNVKMELLEQQQQALEEDEQG